VELTENWGATREERGDAFPCDGLCDAADATYYRAVTVERDAAHVFRWLCQLRVAPYSYDWIDNGGRRSPPTRTPHLEELALGQSLMRIFELRGFEPGCSLTIVNKTRQGARFLFGEVWISYVIRPRSEGVVRLVVKVLVRFSPGLLGLLMRKLLPIGDLIMMRRQLLNLKRLAEGELTAST
jgi:hypothetical protein